LETEKRHKAGPKIFLNHSFWPQKKPVKPNSFHPEIALFLASLPHEMFTPLNAQPIQLGRSLFLWGQSAEYLVRRTTCRPPRNS